MRRAAIVIASLIVPAALAICLAFGLAACGDDGPAGPTPTVTVTVIETPTPSAEPSSIGGTFTTVSLYFLRGETLGVAHRRVPLSGAPATEAMNALLGGPNRREKAAGLGTTIPKGATLNGITIEERVARVDLSEEFAGGGGTLSMQARIAQVVYTLTQFSTVKSVEFLLDGEPVEALGGEGVVIDEPQRRSDWKDLLPAIFVESPAVGDKVGSPVTVKGTAMVFEATFVAEVLDADGTVLTSETVTATRGAPLRGAFKVDVPFDTLSPRVSLRVYDVSMQDGSRMNTVTIPLRFLVSD